MKKEFISDIQSVQDNQQDFTTSVQKGINYFHFNSKGNMIEEHLASYFELTNICQDKLGNEFFILKGLSFRNQKQVIISKDEIGDNSCWKQIRSITDYLTTDKKKLVFLADYIQKTAFERKKIKIDQITDKTGWTDDYKAYILPNGEILVSDDENGEGIFKQEVFFNGKIDDDFREAYETSGTLEEYNKFIIEQAVLGNDFFIFAIGTALAPAILKILNIEGCGFHLYGDSSMGKTTTGFIALSVWGKPKRFSFHATQQGLVNLIARRNDNFSFTDELNNDKTKGELPASLFYFVSEGQTKIAADPKNPNENRPIIFFTGIALTAGEQTYQDYLAPFKIELTAGQFTRCLQLPFESPKNLHGFKQSEDFVNDLRRNKLNNYYGILGRTFVERMLNTPKSDLKAQLEECLKFSKLDTDSLNPQLTRSATYFEVVKAALIYLNSLQIISYLDPQAIDRIFKLWLNDAMEKTGGKKHEDAKIIQQAQNVFLKYFNQLVELREPSTEELKESKKLRINIGDKEIPNYLQKAGYKIDKGKGDKAEWIFYLNTKIFEEEIGKGFTPKKVKEVLTNCGILVENTGNTSFKEKEFLFKGGNLRFYCFRESPLEDDEETVNQ